MKRTIVFFWFLLGLPTEGRASFFKMTLPGEMRGAKLSYCNQENCLVLESPRISIGSLGGNYAFHDLKIFLYRKTDKKNILSVRSQQAYLDQEIGLLFVRDIPASSDQNKELVIRLDSLTFKKHNKGSF